MFLDIKIKHLREGVLPVQAHGDWIDLRCAETIELKAGEYCEIPLGVAMKLPYGYEAHLVVRSSTFKKYGIIQTNGIGIIDNDYCGNTDEWKLPVYAITDTVILKNDRIAQFRIFKRQEDLVFTMVDELEDNDRGGFGSTGRG